MRAWSGRGEARRDALRGMDAELRALREYSKSRDRSVPAFPDERALRGYISGFLLAEGSFRLTVREARAVVNLRADDAMLLAMLARESGLGAVSSYAPGPPLNPVARWMIASRRDLSLLAAWLLEVGLPGHKGEIVRAWAHGIDVLERPVQRRSAVRRYERVRPYRPPRRNEMLAVARPDVREACRQALLAWAAREDGRLSCVRYSRWRAERREHPTRNTIVRHFGGWHAALAAAGLDDRVARAPRRTGGAARREARRRVQRERVLDAVRRFERERGRLPRAMEFFRWRIERAVDAPTQGTVYRLFPGGWDEVLRGARQVAGAVV